MNCAIYVRTQYTCHDEFRENELAEIGLKDG
jgi:hypothetical protein